MSDAFDWKDESITVTTAAATFGVIVPAMMHMEMKELNYSNQTAGINSVILRQIPSGAIRPPASIIIDQQTLASQTPYSPRNPIRTMQENTVLEASANAGPATVSFAYRLRYGRP